MEAKLIQIAPLRDAIYEHSRSYSSWGADYSVTSLIQPPRIVQLQKRYAEELDKLPMTDEFIEQQLSSFQGNAIHERFRIMLYRFINKYPNSGYLIERRMWDRICGRKISGQFDAYRHGALYDFKTTSVWKLIFGQYTSWEEQLNIYAYLLKTCGLDVSVLYIIAWFTDWDKWKVNQKGYPKKRIQQILINNMWKESEQKQYLEHRIELHKQNENRSDDDLMPCTSEEMWSKNTSYAVVQPGGKRAIRTKDLYTREDAENYIKNSKNPDKDKWYVETREGERTRCANWCRYKDYCSQWKEYCQRKDTTNG